MPLSNHDRLGNSPNAIRVSDDAVRVYQSFPDLPASYDALFEHAATRSFYLRRDWFELIFEICAENGETPRIYGLERGGAAAEPIAALIMRGNTVRQSPQQRRVLRGMSNWYSGVFAPLLAPHLADPGDALNRLLRGVARDKPLWDSIEMGPLDPKDGACQALIDALRRNLILPQIYPTPSDWFESLGEGAKFDDYWRSLSSKKRNTLRRKEKAAQAEGNIEFRYYTDETSIDRAVRDYEAIYAQSWKEEELFKAFIPELIRRSARRKILRLGIVYVGGEPAASELCIATGGVAVMAKTAYVEKFATLSVGVLAILNVLRRVLDEGGIREIDFGNGNDSYKREWVRSQRERAGLVGFNLRTLRGLVGAGWNIGGSFAKAKVAKLRAAKSSPTEAAAEPDLEQRQV